MQEHRHDGKDVLTGPVPLSQIMAAALDPRNRAVTLHKPGNIVTLSDGTEYIVQADGSWRRAVPKERKRR